MNKNKNWLNRYNVLLTIAFFLAVVGLSSPYLIKTIFVTASPGELGPIGDWLGGTTAPLFGLAGFVMVLAAFFAQKEELHAQQEELRLTREEFKEQNKTLTKQRFDNTFFQLLALHHQIINAIECNISSRIYNGRQYFQQAFAGFKNSYASRLRKIEREGGAMDPHPFLVKFYEGFYEEYQDYLGHYFRNLYHLLRLVDCEETLTEEEKKNYARLIRAQLSTYELLFLFYNAISKYGTEKFKPLIDKYDLLQNMPKNKLIDISHLQYYNKV